MMLLRFGMIRLEPAELRAGSSDSKVYFAIIAPLLSYNLLAHGECRGRRTS